MPERHGATFNARTARPTSPVLYETISCVTDLLLPLLLFMYNTTDSLVKSYETSAHSGAREAYTLSIYMAYLKILGS